MMNSLKEYQRDAVQRIEQSERGMLVYHRMGLGKSFVAAYFITKEYREGRRPLLIMNTSIRENMLGALSKYLRLEGEEGLYPKVRRSIDFVSLNAYNLGQQFAKAASKLDGRTVIVDEAHNLFRQINNRCPAAMKIYDTLVHSRVKLVFLTGTPVSHDIFEIIPCMNMLEGRMRYSPFDEKDLGAFLPVIEEFASRLVVHHDHDETRLPTVLPLKIEEVRMSKEFYWSTYLPMARKEAKSPVVNQQSNSIANYRMKSRMLCITPEKLERIYRNVMSIPGPGIVYSQFVDKGLKALAAYLDRRGWAPYGTDDRLATNRYVVMSGNMSMRRREELLEIFRSDENRDGRLIRLFLVSSVGSEGISTRWVRHVHSTEPYWDNQRLSQVVARAARLDSHTDLPLEERTIQPFLYISIPPQGVVVTGGCTSDEALYHMSLHRDAQSKRVLDALVRGAALRAT